MDIRPATFTDTEGVSWHIAIKYGDIQRVRRHVTGADGKALDLCYIAETGDFRQVTDHIDLIAQSVYWLLQPAITEYSGLTGVQAQEWFYNRVDGDVIQAMALAWHEALLNFTPSRVVKAAMMTAWETMTRAELIAAIELLAGRLEESGSTPALSASALTATAMES